jgi:hypothetical protein
MLTAFLFRAQVGEQFFELHVQNLHDCRNVKILKIHAIANKEHHRLSYTLYLCTYIHLTVFILQ